MDAFGAVSSSSIVECHTNIMLNSRIKPFGPSATDLTDKLQMGVAGKGVVLETAAHLLVPLSPLHVELRQCLGAAGLEEHHK